MHQLMFANQASLGGESLNEYAQSIGLDMPRYGTCVQSEEFLDRVRSDIELGRQIGVDGTPAFFINGRMIAGARPKDDFLEVIDVAEREAKQSGEPPMEYYERLSQDSCNGD